MTDGTAANDAPLSPTKRGRPKPNALASKIKKLMQSDDDVGKIAQATPCLIGALTVPYHNRKQSLTCFYCTREPWGRASTRGIYMS